MKNYSKDIESEIKKTELLEKVFDISGKACMGAMAVSPIVAIGSAFLGASEGFITGALCSEIVEYAGAFAFGALSSKQEDKLEALNKELGE